MSTQKQTAAVRCGIESDREHGAVVPPLYLSSNFAFEGFDRKREYDYTRSGNPTRDQLGEALAELEGGAGAVVTGSGMSAVFLVTQLLQPDDLVLAAHDCYGGCHRLFDSLSRQSKLTVEFCDLTQTVSAAAQIKARRPRVVWVETPSNPLLRVTDIRAISDACKAVDALLVVDNTFLSPALQRPIELGADLVVHSTTKYLNGHSDVVGGAVVAATEALYEDLTWWANCIGVTGAPFDSFLTLRGVRTLHARIAQHERNTREVVDALAAHPAVSRIYYPGLSSHPGHAVARRQQQGFGGMVSFELAAGEASVATFVESLRLFSLAESLGGVESLVAHPATMTHAAMTPEARETAGISGALVRLSVGIEHAEDLVEDLTRALDQVQTVPQPTPAAQAAC
ncbi:MAG: cystathionine gamma-synthase [Xanthomonadales bacterium]|nr:cystathionine gamma-synthase [Xanthomonadales bacterium]